jgi:hypothetical protein
MPKPKPILYANDLYDFGKYMFSQTASGGVLTFTEAQKSSLSASCETIYGSSRGYFTTG